MALSVLTTTESKGERCSNLLDVSQVSHPFHSVQVGFRNAVAPSTNRGDHIRSEDIHLNLQILVRLIHVNVHSFPWRHKMKLFKRLISAMIRDIVTAFVQEGTTEGVTIPSTQKLVNGTW